MPFQTARACLLALIMAVALPVGAVAQGARAPSPVSASEPSRTTPPVPAAQPDPGLPGRTTAAGLAASSVPTVGLVKDAAAAAAHLEPGVGDDRRSRLFGAAAREGLLAYIAMRTAGPLCSDTASPDEYLHELGLALAPVLDWLRRADPETRRRVVEDVLAADARAPWTGRRDPLLCKRGRYGGRYCEGAGAPCDPDRSARPEYVLSDPFLALQVRVRRRAREDVRALIPEASTGD